MRERRRKPTGYHIKFTIVGPNDYRENGHFATGAGEAYAHSLSQLNKVMKLLTTRMDLRAEVITIWGPLATPREHLTALWYF
jgi:hypothetical protein